MTNFNAYSLVPFTSSILLASLGLLCFRKHRTSPVHRVFFRLCFSVVPWPFALGVMLNLHDAPSILWWTKVGHLTCTIAPAIYLDFVATLLKQDRLRVLVRSCYLYAFVTIPMMVFTNYYFKSEVYSYQWGSYVKANWFATIDAMLGVVVASLAFILLLRGVHKARMHSTIVEYNRLKYIAVALGFFCFALLDYLPKYGIDMLPIGSLFILAFAIIVTYAIVRHQVLDFGLVVRRTAIYSILAALITASYLVVVLVTEKWFQGFLGYRSLVATSVAGFTIALGFVPLRNAVQQFVDRYFFQGSQEELASQNEQLRKEVQRTEQLKSVATLAAGMAHEIKNPLAVIKTFAEFLPEKYDDPNFREKFSRVMSQEVDKMNVLVHQLLEFAKPAPPQLQPVRVSKVVTDTIDFLHETLLKRRIEVQMSFAERDSVAADPAQMRQVFLNVLMNSIEAMPEGGSISISSVQKNGHLDIALIDDGPGMAPIVAARVFDPFYTTKPDGTGLGLSVVHSIVREHKGHVSVKSHIGQGTEVRIRLPINGGTNGATAHSDRG